MIPIFMQNFCKNNKQILEEGHFHSIQITRAHQSHTGDVSQDTTSEGGARGITVTEVEGNMKKVETEKNEFLRTKQR
jgi:hypothetical protein